MSPILVEDRDVRSARNDGTCFDCHAALGEPHTIECVIPQKWVRVRVTMDLITEVSSSPTYGNKQALEFRWNEGTWCADNLIDALSREADAREKQMDAHQHGESFDQDVTPCLCSVTRIDVIETVDPAPHRGLDDYVFLPGVPYSLGFPSEKPLAGIPANGDETEAELVRLKKIEAAARYLIDRRREDPDWAGEQYITWRNFVEAVGE